MLLVMTVKTATVTALGRDDARHGQAAHGLDDDGSAHSEPACQLFQRRQPIARRIDASADRERDLIDHLVLCAVAPDGRNTSANPGVVNFSSTVMPSPRF